MQKIKTGLYGGSFNPIHCGHLAVARAVVASGLADEVWFMVSPQNPLKASMSLLDDDRRLAMARRAVEGEPHLTASDYEFALPRPSYTWNTLQCLRRDFPMREFTLIIGGDNWTTFRRWYRADEILGMCNIAVYPRQGFDIDEKALPANVSIVDAPLHNVSSTEVRRLAAEGASVSGLVPPAIEAMVAEYYGRR